MYMYIHTVNLEISKCIDYCDFWRMNKNVITGLSCTDLLPSYVRMWVLIIAIFPFIDIICINKTLKIISEFQVYDIKMDSYTCSITIDVHAL